VVVFDVPLVRDRRTVQLLHREECRLNRGQTVPACTLVTLSVDEVSDDLRLHAYLVLSVFIEQVRATQSVVRSYPIRDNASAVLARGIRRFVPLRNVPVSM